MFSFKPCLSTQSRRKYLLCEYVQSRFIACKIFSEQDNDSVMTENISVNKDTKCIICVEV